MSGSTVMSIRKAKYVYLCLKYTLSTDVCNHMHDDLCSRKLAGAMFCLLIWFLANLTEERRNLCMKQTQPNFIATINVTMRYLKLKLCTNLINNYHA